MDQPYFLSLADEVAARIDPVCDAFEKALRAGTSPRIEEYLSRVDIETRPYLLRELLGLELEYRIACGDNPEQEAFDRRLPGAQSSDLGKKDGVRSK